ncbi:MAG TPA: ferredoxin family protein [Syntrophorhabdales bacterium]|nr:ferredoxin family protein [Syntrophorhabdales bacterium]
MPPEIDHEKCTACGVCVDVCAEDVFFDETGTGGLSDEDERQRDKKKPGVTYPEACFHCYLCAQTCPQGAITIRTPLIMHVPYK